MSRSTPAKTTTQDQAASTPREASWTIHAGDCIAGMDELPAGCVDLVFADPPYNLQIGGSLTRPDQSRVDGVDDAWDKFGSFCEYDAFTRSWLTAARRAMSRDATIFVIGSYHNIFRVGAILQDLGFWILNDIVWTKTNPMPNFRGRRFTNAHETMIWAARSKDSRYTFNYEALKAGNDDVQMRSDWSFPVCAGPERLRTLAGDKLHPTQKPSALVRRSILAASRPGALVLDPFSGSGTTAACAKALGRSFVGFEREKAYLEASRNRLEATEVLMGEALAAPVAKRDAPKVPFLSVVEAGLVPIGSLLNDPKGRWQALVRADGTISCQGHVGSIHQVAARLQGLAACNGWGFWSHEQGGVATSIDAAREALRAKGAT